MASEGGHVKKKKILRKFLKKKKSLLYHSEEAKLKKMDFHEIS